MPTGKIVTPVRQSRNQHRLFAMLCQAEGHSMNDVLNRLIAEYIEQNLKQLRYYLDLNTDRVGKISWVISVQEGSKPARVVDSGIEVGVTKEVLITRMERKYSSPVLCLREEASSVSS